MFRLRQLSFILLALAATFTARRVLDDGGRNELEYSGRHFTTASAVIESTNVTSRLFPPALDMMKRKMRLDDAYACYDEDFFSLAEAQKTRQPPIAGLEHTNIKEELQSFGNNSALCSCDAPQSAPQRNSALCCQRRIFSGHKMGTFLQMSLEQEMKKRGIEKGDFDQFSSGRDIPYIKDHLLEPVIDFRDVMIIRNLYDSLISGYLYHKEGKECWLDWNGNEGWDPNLFPSFWMKGWMRYIDLASHKTKIYDTLCHALAENTEEIGMRIYIDFVFHAFYGKTFEFWALSNGRSCEPVRKRVRTFCFEDLEQGESSSAIEAMFGFLTDESPKEKFEGGTSTPKEEPGTKKQAYDGGHSTNHDPALRLRLLKIVKLIDSEYYNNDLEWLNATLPCR